MSQRPNNLDTTLLAIELLRRIPRHRKITASELRKSLLESGFDRDLRTIQRHLEALAAHFEELEALWLLLENHRCTCDDRCGYLLLHPSLIPLS